MTTSIELERFAITVNVVPDEERLDFLPKMLGTHFGIVFDQHIFRMMDSLCAHYNGGYWEFYELSNGGFYLGLPADEKFTLSVAGNFFEGEMSGDAAGIVVTFFVLSRLACESQDDNIALKYQLLYEYIYYHPEISMILAAID